MVLTTYGRSSGFCIDPIEKKPLPILSRQQRVFVRHRRLQSGVQILPELGYQQIARDGSRDGSGRAERDRACRPNHGCKSVAFTYNDPVIFAEYAMDVADDCHERGIKTVAVTAGYMHDQARRDFYGRMDAANVDLKAFTEEFYVKLTGSQLQPSAGNLGSSKRETKVWLEITTLLIPGKRFG